MELIELVLKHLVINHFLHCNYSELKIVGKAYSYPYVFSVLLAFKKKKTHSRHILNVQVCKGIMTSFKICVNLTEFITLLARP